MKIEFQIGVHHSDLRRMIAQSVVAGGKAGNGIDMRFPESILPLFPIKFHSDFRDVRRGVKIKMNLAKTELIHSKQILRLFSLVILIQYHCNSTPEMRNFKGQSLENSGTKPLLPPPPGRKNHLRKQKLLPPAEHPCESGRQEDKKRAEPFPVPP